MEEEKPKEEKKVKEIVIPSISLPKLKGKNKFETAENYSILLIVIGVIILSLGIGLTIVVPQGIPAILAMIGSFISFLATVILILVWLVREFVGE